jgi:hypothetical protein
LVIGFIEHLLIVTTSNYSAIVNWYSVIYYSKHLNFLSLLFAHLLSGNSFQQCPLFPDTHSYRLATVPQLSTLNSTWLHSTNWIELHRSTDITSERTHRGHCFKHLFYCCVKPSRTWDVPLLRVYGPLPGNRSICYNMKSEYWKLIWHILLWVLFWLLLQLLCYFYDLSSRSAPIYKLSNYFCVA